MGKMHTCAKDLRESIKPITRPKLIPVHFIGGEAEEKRIKKELAPIKERVIFPKDSQEINL